MRGIRCHHLTGVGVRPYPAPSFTGRGLHRHISHGPRFLKATAILAALDRGSGIYVTLHTSSAFGLGKDTAYGGCTPLRVFATVVALGNLARLRSPALTTKGCAPVNEVDRASSFDEVARGLDSGTVSRGKALKLMGAALVGGTLASLGIREASAAPGGCKRRGKNCSRNRQCCSGNCSRRGRCVRRRPGCKALGQICTSSADCCSGFCRPHTFPVPGQLRCEAA